jgi:DNA-directed RNA polymerase sigma subunit (sigma70/sigma32)
MLHAKIGLLKAAHRFDESKMVSFRLYAIWWMRQVILKALHEQARIEQIPEMLILQLHNLMRSFTRREQLLLEGFEETNQIAVPKINTVLRLKKPGTKN